ncbi:MAG TPA: CheR family methyltransferase [Caulobacteraceae bacterium]|nr:CheR family methyltransferase [Caulobacteraceae bacterium]
MSPDDLAFVVALCGLQAGLNIAADRTYSTETRLTALARRQGLVSAEAVIAAARHPSQARLRWRIVEAMAAGETSFFRDRAFFEHLRDGLLPGLGEARKGSRLRLWSAGCATGQEAYSLAILAEEAAETWGDRADVYASDINSAELQRARSGLFSQSEVQRGLPIRLLIRHFEKVGEDWQASPELRARLRWRRLNLAARFEEIGSFDVILCRYVLSRMDAPGRIRALASLRRALAPDGTLALGMDETIAEIGDFFLADAGPPGIYRSRPRPAIAAA